jgi:putative ABC transport system substrate-binding protein
MRRREVIATLAAVAVQAALLLPAHAQTSGVRRIGVIYHGGPYEVSIEGLREGLRAPASGLPPKRSRVNTSTVT